MVHESYLMGLKRGKCQSTDEMPSLVGRTFQVWNISKR